MELLQTIRAPMYWLESVRLEEVRRKIKWGENAKFAVNAPKAREFPTEPSCLCLSIPTLGDVLGATGWRIWRKNEGNSHLLLGQLFGSHM